ncbi:MAG: nuclear transport factor 2 family protein [Candidatus Sulfotelmatobacter sp.]|jgi:ketosteroid isomerase-like protein
MPLVVAAELFAQNAGPAETQQVRILALENAWNRAVQEKNRAALDMLMGPELVYVDYDGTLMGKAEYLASVKSSPLHPAHVLNEFMNVNLYGTVAVVNGVYRESGEKNGKPYTLRERFTDTWVSRDGNWMCVASESTLISH